MKIESSLLHFTFLNYLDNQRNIYFRAYYDVF